MADEPTIPVDNDLVPPAPVVGGDPPVTEEKSADGENPAATEEKAAETEEKKESDKPEPRAPEEYAEFTVPEGVAIDEARLAEFKTLAKELDLPQEQAQKLLEFGGSQIKEMTEGPYRLWAELQKKWQADIKADPEIGGTNYEESTAAAALVFEPGESNPFIKDAAEGKSLREALFVTGAGNNPEIVRLFVRLGSLLKEPGNFTGGPIRDKQQSLYDSLYPSMSGGDKGA